MPGLITISGPTAMGKSALALAIAERFGLVILSADSRQVYQEFDIGTAKPSAEDQRRVPHEFIDICPPTLVFTVADYQQMAQRRIAELHAQGQTPLLVGGTGLYIQSVVEGLTIPRVPPHPLLRSQLEQVSQAERYQWLQQVDPTAAAKIHAHDATRTLRSLEVFYVTGLPLSAQQGKTPPTYPMLHIGLDIPDKKIALSRIFRRTETMLAQGWLNEVQQLIQAYGPELPLLNTLGYAELHHYLQTQQTATDLEIAIEAIARRTRQFAKRQRTWFRAGAAIRWLDASQPQHVATAIGWIAEFLGVDPLPGGC